MGSALGCASNDAGGKADELQGKFRYLGDIGAAVHVIEENQLAIGHFIVYVDVDGKITFSCHITSEDKLYVATFTDEEFRAKKEASQITLSFNAIFKSIATETTNGKVKVGIQEATVSAQFNISSVKDAKTTQSLSITLDVSTDPKAIAFFHIHQAMSGDNEARQRRWQQNQPATQIQIQSLQQQINEMMSRMNTLKNNQNK